MCAIPQHRQPRALTLEDGPVVARVCVCVCLCLCGKRGYAALANFQSKGDQVKDVKHIEFVLHLTSRYFLLSNVSSEFIWIKCSIMQRNKTCGSNGASTSETTMHKAYYVTKSASNRRDRFTNDIIIGQVNAFRSYCHTKQLSPSTTGCDQRFIWIRARFT